MTRKILAGLVGVLLLPALLLLVMILLIDPNAYKARLQAAAAQQGVDLVLGGDIRWSFLPRPAFVLAGVDAVVPLNGQRVPFHADGVRLALALAPLFRGQVVFSTLDLSGGSAQLATGDGNVLTVSKTSVQIRDLSTAGEPFPLALSLELGRDDLLVALTVQTGVRVDLASQRFTLQQLLATVDATAAALPSGRQSLALQVVSLQLDRPGDLLAVSGLALQLGGITLRADVAGQQLTGAAQVTLAPLSVTFDNKGALAGRLQWQQGAWRLELAGDQLDPGPWLPAGPQAKARQLPMADILLAASMQDKVLTLQNLSAAIYDGRIKLDGTVDFRQAGKQKLALAAKADGVQLAVLLNDWQQAPSSLVAGVLQLDTRLTASARSQQPWLNTLSGTLGFTVTDLVVDRLNLEKSACEAAAMLQHKPLPAREWPGQTAVRELRGNANLVNGIAFLSPVTARLDSLDLAGKGPVNLINHTLDLALDLTLTGDSQGKNVCDVVNPRLVGIAWPLRCKGNYAEQAGQALCGVDQSRLDKLLLQALGGQLDESMGKKMGEQGRKLKEALQGLFH